MNVRVLSHDELNADNYAMNELKYSSEDLRLLENLRQSRSSLSQIKYQINASKLISQLSRRRQFSSIHALLELLESTNDCDITCYSSAMTAFIQNQLFEDALHVFNRMKTSQLSLDLVTYVSTVRAVGHCRSWDILMDMLEEAYSVVGSEISEVLNAAIINLKYCNGYSKSKLKDLTQQELVHKAIALFDWLKSKDTRITPKTMDSLLAVISTHGTPHDILIVLQTMKDLDLPMTVFSMNTLLSRYVAENDSKSALLVLKDMKSHNIEADLSTYNTLLKLSLHNQDLKSALDVISLMESKNISTCHRTKALIIRIFGESNDINAALRIIDNEPDVSVTNYMFSNAISVCQHYPDVALRLLQRAIRLDSADEAVYTSAAQILVSNKMYLKALKIIDYMIFTKNFSFNKYSLSVAISLCLKYHAFLNNKLDSSSVSYDEKDIGAYSITASKRLSSPSSSADFRLKTELSRYKDSGLTDYLDKYIKSVQSHQPHLLSDALCQKLMKGLCGLGHEESSYALTLHLTIFHEYTCKPEVLSLMLENIQELANVYVSDFHLEEARNLARKSLALIGLYYRSYQQTDSYNDKDALKVDASPSISQPHRAKLRTTHFNSVLRLLTMSKMFEESNQLFKFMSGSSVGSLTRNSLHNRGYDWNPSTFTIAELIRSARESKSLQLAHDVMIWAARFQEVYLPIGVISDAVSLVYDVGRIDLALSIYTSLYQAHKIQHWQDMSNHIMDVHNYSRGMAYAAIDCAIKEVLSHVKRTPNTNKTTVSLIIITGQSLNRPKSSSSHVGDILYDGGTRGSDRLENDSDSSYLLVKELQTVLIEDFYPPISSSTVPGNPGRLMIQLHV